MDRTRLARAVLGRLDPETAHELTLWALRHGLGPARAGPDDPVLAVRLWRRDFANPLVASPLQSRIALLSTLKLNTHWLSRLGRPDL